MILFIKAYYNSHGYLSDPPIYIFFYWIFANRVLMGISRFLFNIPIFDLNKINWCTLAFSKQNFKQLQSSGEELLHNEAHSTSQTIVVRPQASL